jgi:hypothetical protein
MHLLRNLGKWQDLRGRNVTFDRQVINYFIASYQPYWYKTYAAVLRIRDSMVQIRTWNKISLQITLFWLDIILPIYLT